MAKENFFVNNEKESISNNEFKRIKKENGLYNYQKLDGTLVSPNEDFLYGISLNNEGFLPVTRQNKLENYLKLDGTFLLPVDFTVEKSFKDGVAEITITCKVDKEGNLII